jgi:hypothetical protein
MGSRTGMTRREDVMNVAYNVSEQSPPVEAEASRLSTPLRVARYVLLPLSLILWAIGVSQTSTANLGLFGLPAQLPIVFYAGIGVLLVSAGIEFSRARLSQAWLGGHAVALVVMLYGTAPLVYKEGRYAWLYKTIGIVDYVAAHGSLDRSIDIYQNWPGFFALAAWFDKVAGVTPFDYAKWAQLVFELAAIPLLYTIYKALSLPVWHRWLAIMLYAASNWIAQDYFSPQGMSTLLSLGVLALVAQWTLTVGRGGQRRLRESAPFLAVLIFLFFVLTASHELSPYIVAIQIAALAITGLARPRWIALVVAAITIGYLVPNFTFVNEHYGILSSIGNFFSNLRPPEAAGSGLTIPLSHRIISDGTALLSGLVWLLAVVGAWLNRKSARRTVLALLLMTFTPVLVLVAGAYGNEGILRVYLFSLPSAAALAACALAPRRVGALAADAETEAAAAPDAPRHGHRSRRAGLGPAIRAALAATAARPAAAIRAARQRLAAGPVGRALTGLLARLRAVLPVALRTALRAVVPLVVAVALFMPSFFGDDASNMMTTSEVQTLLAFQEQAKPGVILNALNNAPVSDTANYNEWPNGAIFSSEGIVPAGAASPDIAAYLARTMVHYFGTAPAYVVVSPSMIAYNNAYGLTERGNFATLLASVAKSPYWTLVESEQGTIIYQMTGAAAHIPPGSYAKYPVVGVP